LADALGSDDYGMKMYVLVILKTGAASFDKKITDSLFNVKANWLLRGRLKKRQKITGVFLFST